MIGEYLLSQNFASTALLLAVAIPARSKRLKKFVAGKDNCHESDSSSTLQVCTQYGLMRSMRLWLHIR
ncbi:hypothetical protein LCGC14_1547530 [marine sediment metagenome]|uniref:Uncharacterized protein n=1 Tax=marine sediment metagenome TaxID=412755 RepID=A0A0F9IR92_9ZZZZ